MTLYNKALDYGTSTNETFWIALKAMWGEYVISFLCFFFISSRVSKFFAFRIVEPAHLNHLCYPDLYGGFSGCIDEHFGIFERFGFTN